MNHNQSTTFPVVSDGQGVGRFRVQHFPVSPTNLGALFTESGKSAYGIQQRGRIGTLSGHVAPFVRAIASPNLEDLTIEPARLEEAFLEYYADDGEPISSGADEPQP